MLQPPWTDQPKPKATVQTMQVVSAEAGFGNPSGQTIHILKGDYIGDILGEWKRKWKLLFGVQGLCVSVMKVQVLSKESWQKPSSGRPEFPGKLHTWTLLGTASWRSWSSQTTCSKQCASDFPDPLVSHFLSNLIFLL